MRGVPASATSPIQPAAGGLRLLLRLQANARGNAVEGVVGLADGRKALKARVTAPPEDGRANAALIKLLAKTWRLPKSAITIVAGQRDRTKILLIEGDAKALEAAVQRWLDQERASGSR